MDPHKQSKPAQQSLKRLCKVIKGILCTKLTEVEVVISFDETHTLTNGDGISGHKSLYDILCWAVTFCVHKPLFFIFLSTNSQMPKLAATRDNAKSARVASGEAELNTPITETPFDCYPDTMKKGELLLQDTRSITFLARFGRPL